MGWFENRFVFSARKVEQCCTECGRKFWMPPSKAGKYKRCSPGCVEKKIEATKKKNTETCVLCRNEFIVRPSQIRSGQGKYCSIKCSTTVNMQRNSPEAMEKKRKTFYESLAAGKIIIRSGVDHPQWTGGHAASQRRWVDSGKCAAYQRKYCAENPERVREWADRRIRGRDKRLPWGTVQRLQREQRWKCAICKKSVRKGYHLDHITPIALGGLHEPYNLQLLCPPCNLRKSAKDPIDYMQERGFLLRGVIKA